MTSPTLLDITAIAARFGVKRRTVAEGWIHRPDFPAPRFAPSTRVRLWDAADVDRWATPAGRRSAQPSPGSTYSPESARPDAR